MKKLITIIIPIIVLFTTTAAGIAPPVKPEVPVPIAVLPLEGKGVSPQESDILTERLRSALVQDGQYQVIERSRMEEILIEQGFQQTGCVSNECIVEVGLLLGVKYMVGGTVGKLGASYTIDVRLFDTETAEIIRAVTRNYRGEIDDLLPLMMEIATALAGEDRNLTSEQTTRPAQSLAEIIDNSIGKVTQDLSGTATPAVVGVGSTGWTPFQFSFAYPLQLVPATFMVYGFSFNAVYGVNHSVYGVDAGLINEVRFDLIGVQVGLKNNANKVFGLQYGLLNSTEKLYGMQAGLLNESGKTRGLQLGLINNSDDLIGVQIGVLNQIRDGGGTANLPIINIGF
ncbi:MAG: CsgG/HfaB family protein [Candidatus Neomarinimicrobiota bacterium]